MPLPHLTVGVKQHLRRRFSVQEVINPGVGRPELLGSLDWILVGEDYRLARLRKRAQRSSSRRIDVGPPDEAGHVLAGSQLLLNLRVLLGLVAARFDDLDVVSEILGFGLGADLPLRKVVVRAWRHEDDDLSSAFSQREGSGEAQRESQ